MAKKDELNALARAKQAAEDLSAHERSLRERHAALTKERQAVDLALPPRAEVLANMENLVDAAAARFAEDFGSRVVSDFAGDLDLTPSGKYHRRSPRLFQAPDSTKVVELLCGVAPGLVKERFASMIRAGRKPFGLPAAERASKLAELNQAIADVEREHTELVDAAGALGLELPLLEPEAERRAQAASRAQQERELEAERKAAPPPPAAVVVR